MQFPQGPKLNVQGVGPTLGAAFAEAALAMIALLTDLAAIRLEETIEIECDAPSAGRLFEPAQVGSWALPNRIVMAPLTRSRAAAGDVPTQLHAHYYADLVIRLFLDAPLAAVNQDLLYGGAEQGYTDYPILRGVAPHACYTEAKGDWG